MKTRLLLLFVLFAYTASWAQPAKWKNKKHFTVVSYNVENLFDTIDNPHKNDNEFTPEASKKWNSERYFDKIDKLAFVLSDINKHELPELIGLVEVENKSVLNDLTNNSKLKDGSYSIIIENGPDPRGINCALLYRESAFKYLNHQSLPVAFPFANNKRTRDILYVKGLVNKDTVHVFVNHWSSRRGGQEKSEPKRVQSATVLKTTIDSIKRSNPLASLIIMGDFNDQPDNKSLHEVLQAGRTNENLENTNLLFNLFEQGKGTYYYRGNFNMLDHLIVDQQTLNKTKGLRLIDKQAYIHKPDTICFTNKNGDKSPSKSFGGPNYYGGFSDHFPIYTFFYEK